MNYNLPGDYRSTRCKVLGSAAKIRKSYTQPPLIKRPKLKLEEWASKHFKTDFSEVS